ERLVFGQRNGHRLWTSRCAMACTFITLLQGGVHDGRWAGNLSGRQEYAQLVITVCAKCAYIRGDCPIRCKRRGGCPRPRRLNLASVPLRSVALLAAMGAALDRAAPIAASGAAYR